MFHKAMLTATPLSVDRPLSVRDGQVTVRTLSLGCPLTVCDGQCRDKPLSAHSLSTCAADQAVEGQWTDNTPDSGGTLVDE